MKRNHASSARLLFASILFGCVVKDVPAASCSKTPPDWRNMDSQQITVVDKEGSALSFEVKVADDQAERTAGFQHACPDVIAQKPILFLFRTPLRPAFHMRNVYAPLDIAFIDADGRLIELQRMQPYILGSRGKRHYYQPKQRILAALEAHEGFFEKNGIAVGDRIVPLPR